MDTTEVAMDEEIASLGLAKQRLVSDEVMGSHNAMSMGC